VIGYFIFRLLCIVLICAGFLVPIYFWYRNKRINAQVLDRYKPLSGWPTVSVLDCEDEDRLSTAIMIAVSKISEIWPNAESLIRGTRIRVATGEEFYSPENKCMVRGLTYENIEEIVIGNDYSALAHELAHIIYFDWHYEQWEGRSRLTEIVDDEFPKWIMDTKR
jgi:hypothetical protein